MHVCGRGFGFPGQFFFSDRYHYEYQKEWFHRINSEKELSYIKYPNAPTFLIVPTVWIHLNDSFTETIIISTDLEPCTTG